MKIIKNRTLFAFTVALLILLVSFPFQACERDEDNCDCDTCDSMVVYKPNIYLYPMQESDISVTLTFPSGGRIITSIPEYNTGWNIHVTPEGIIDNEYNFLFYESTQPDIWQRNYGWVIPKANLELFFRQNMSGYGFYEKEINDFIDYWIPLLENNAYYVIYPQTSEIIERVIQLQFSLNPEVIIRLFYLIKGIDEANAEPVEPVVVMPPTRIGFNVAEWGVIID